jgi:hypothetical protein
MITKASLAKDIAAMSKNRPKSCSVMPHSQVDYFQQKLTGITLEPLIDRKDGGQYCGRPAAAVRIRNDNTTGTAVCTQHYEGWQHAVPDLTFRLLQHIIEELPV